LATLYDASAMPGLDIGQVENERKDMWRNLFQKYENLEQQDENIELSLDDLKNPEKVSKLFKDAKGTLLQPNSTLKRYIREHADEMDEIATIAGPPMSDEEVLSDDSDEELLADDGEFTDETIDTESVELPLTPASSNASGHNTDDDSELGNNVNNVNEGYSGDDDYDDKDATLSEHDEDSTLVDTDDDDSILYTPNIISQTRSIFNNQSSKPLSQEPALKKQRIMSSHINENLVMTKTVSEDKIGDPEGSGETLGKSGTKSTQSENLVCCQCKTSSLYQALEVSEDQFVCDECMVGDHMDCMVDECEVCKEVGELIRFRRNAEVLARVQKQVTSISDEAV